MKKVLATILALVMALGVTTMAWAGNEGPDMSGTVVNVTADNNGQKLTRRYEAETVWKLPAEGVEPEFDKLLSMTVSKALSRMASDYELIQFMQKTVLRTRDIK